GDWPYRGMGVGDGDFWLAANHESSSVGELGRVGPGPVSEWRNGPRSGHHARREPPRASRHGATGVGMAALSTDQCSDRVVPAAVWAWRQTATPHWDHRAGSQTAHCTLALSPDRRGARWRTTETAGGVTP